MNIHIKSVLSALAFSFLFYSKSLGLNLFLISILVVVLVSTLKQERSISWRYAAVYIATAVFVFLNPTGFTIFVHIMTFLVFVGKLISNKSSLYVSWMLGLINMLVASAANYGENRNETAPEKKTISPKLLNRLKGGLVASILILLFGLLYRNANPVFGNLVDHIDFDFISIPWLLFTILGYVIFLHILSPFHPREIVAFDLGQTNFLEKPTEIVLIGEKKKLESEHTLGSMIFIALNLLLFLFLTTDVIYLLKETDLSNSDYSQSVHEGVYALMFSIICAIALILYFFRGNLNFFKGNQRIKTLTYIWIVLNVILVIFTAYKNYAYIEALGLTYKRIGVFVYLLLTLTGLVTAYIKVAQIKNFVYLVRTNIATLFSFLVISAAIPWDKSITKYNLSQIANPDIEYLIDLGKSNSEQLYEYSKAKRGSLAVGLETLINEKHRDFSEVQAQKTWQEYSFYNLSKNLLK